MWRFVEARPRESALTARVWGAPPSGTAQESWPGDDHEMEMSAQGPNLPFVFEDDGCRDINDLCSQNVKSRTRPMPQSGGQNWTNNTKASKGAKDRSPRGTRAKGHKTSAPPCRHISGPLPCRFSGQFSYLVHMSRPCLGKSGSLERGVIQICQDREHENVKIQEVSCVGIGRL